MRVIVAKEVVWSRSRQIGRNVRSIAVVLRKLFIFILLAIATILADGNFSEKALVNCVGINYVNYGTKNIAADSYTKHGQRQTKDDRLPKGPVLLFSFHIFERLLFFVSF